jgi:cellulose biosynthesis protein BcsQ
VPAPLSVRTLDQLRSFIAEAKGPAPDLLAFLSMVDRRRRLHRDLSEQLPKEHQDVAGTTIPMASVVEQMGVRRAPVVAWARTSPASVAYRSLWDEARLHAKL